MNLQEELNEFITKLERFSAENCPLWLTPNSHFFGIRPGHNLDLLEISFDFKVDRDTVIKSDATEYLSDPSKTDLKVVK